MFPLSELEKRPDSGREWVGDFLLLLSFGRLLQWSPPVVIVLLAFRGLGVREESRIVFEVISGASFLPELKACPALRS